MAKKQDLFRGILYFLGRAQKPILTQKSFSKFNSNTASVSVAMLDLSTKPHNTKLENDSWTSSNKRQLVERNRLNLYSVQQRSTADQNAEWYISAFNYT